MAAVQKREPELKIEMKPGEWQSFRFVVWHNDRWAVIRDESGKLLMLELREAIPEITHNLIFRRGAAEYETPFSRTAIKSVEIHCIRPEKKNVLTDEDIAIMLDNGEAERNEQAKLIAPEILDAFENERLNVLQSNKAEIAQLFDFAVQFMLQGRSNDKRGDKCFRWQDVLYIRTQIKHTPRYEAVAKLLNDRITSANKSFDADQEQLLEKIADEAKRDFEEADNALSVEYENWLNSIFLTREIRGKIFYDSLADYMNHSPDEARRLSHDFWNEPEYKIRFADGSIAFSCRYVLRALTDDEKKDYSIDKPLIYLFRKGNYVYISGHIESTIKLGNSSDKVRFLKTMLDWYLNGWLPANISDIYSEMGYIPHDRNPVRAFRDSTRPEVNALLSEIINYNPQTESVDLAAQYQYIYHKD